MADTLVYDSGYGILPRAFMKDRNLSIQAKAIFAYFVTYAGNTNIAFPGRSLISEDLGISDDTLGKYLKELRDKGYIQVEQVKDNGKFSHNVYTLIPFPNSSDTEISPPLPKSSVSVKPGTNNNSINNNNNSLICQVKF